MINNWYIVAHPIWGTYLSLVGEGKDGELVSKVSFKPKDKNFRLIFGGHVTAFELHGMFLVDRIFNNRDKYGFRVIGKY